MCGWQAAFCWSRSADSPQPIGRRSPRGRFTPSPSFTFMALCYLHGPVSISCKPRWSHLGRTLKHRAWGLAGISLFTAMMCSILLGQEAVLARNAALGYGEAALRFSAVTLLAWPLMAVIFALAIVNIRRPETHKRLMTLLMIGMMTPAIARLFLTFFAPPGLASGRRLPLSLHRPGWSPICFSSLPWFAIGATSAGLIRFTSMAASH